MNDFAVPVPSSEELALAAHHGDEDAFEALYRRWAGPLYGIFTNPYRMPADSWPDADGLVRDTLTEAWKSLRTTIPRDFRSWIAAIASRQWAAYLASKKKHLTYEIDIIDPEDTTIAFMFRTAEQRASWERFVTLVRNAIDSLPAEYRAPLRASLENNLVGKALAEHIGSTGRQADRWRSDGLRLLYNTMAVTAMAQGVGEAHPCPRFERLVAHSEWRDGPLGEKLCKKLTRHLAQCKTCTGVRDKLKSTLELIPAFVPILIPAELLATARPAEADKARKRAKDKNDPGGTPPPPPHRNPAGPSAASKTLSGIGALVRLIIVAGLITGGVIYYEHHQHRAIPGITGAAGQSTLSMWIADNSLTVHSSPAGLNCQGLCHGSFTTGTTVTLRSNYQPGSLPLNWVGCHTATSSAADQCTVTLNHDTAVCIAPYDPAQPNLVTPADCRRRASGR